MNVSVYSKPVCVQCKATKRAFDNAGVRYTEIDLSQDEKALNKVKALGYSAAPVVIAGSEHWSGFRPDKIKETVKKVNIGRK
ncbi:MAG: glutaredoxin-like protein NrdH [Actinomycetaceae bacterium]|nr:glutaredoxin-like protein NrdH [Actinomycetaceae bacterium]